MESHLPPPKRGVKVLFKDKLKEVSFDKAFEYIAQCMMNDAKMAMTLPRDQELRDRLCVEYIEAIGTLHNSEPIPEKLVIPDGVIDYRKECECIFREAEKGKIAAIKKFREVFGAGLADAKNAIDEYIQFPRSGVSPSLEGLRHKEWIYEHMATDGTTRRYLVWKEGYSDLKDECFQCVSMEPPF